MANSDKFTFIIESHGKSVEETTTNLNKLSETLETTNTFIQSDFTTSLGLMFESCTNVTKLFTDLSTQVETLSENIGKLITSVPNVPGNEKKGEKKEKPSDPRLKSAKETFYETAESVDPKKEPTYVDELKKLYNLLIKNFGIKEEDWPENKKNEGQGKEKAEEKKNEKGNFGLDGITKVSEESSKKEYALSSIKKGNGLTDLKKTREQIEKTIANLDKYDAKLAASKELANKFLDETLGKYDKESEEYKVASEAKIQYDKQYNKLKEEGDKKRAEAEKAAEKMAWGKVTATSERLNKLKEEYLKFGTETFDKLAAHNTASKELYEAQAKKIKEEITKVDEKLKASNDLKKKLQEEEKTATGGRLIVIQEQMAREIAANEELNKQKASLAKEEEKMKKLAEKREKRAERMKVAKEIVTATSSVATGIAKELSKGLWGIPTAAIIAAQGAIQIATIKKQYDKINMESGGLLRGKRHSQGGMRIEGSNIEVEGGEYVVNRKSTNKNLGLIDFINRNRRELTPEDIKSYYNKSGKHPLQVNNQTMKNMYEDGGILTDLTTIDNASAQSVDTKILEAISQINFRPVVSVVDINNAQRTISEVKNVAGA